MSGKKQTTSVSFPRALKNDAKYVSGQAKDLYADPDMRGKGVGRALIEHVYASAAHEAAARVWWLTHESNLDAMQLYDRIADKSGFVQYRKLIG